ncbi:MAG: 6-bladed beta-propeller [Bacteroidales bacterium]|jgi:DNA-binding beta-propeller fold protein YncE|nr:6-bladed beta-propeller [Bacteroidales bacterium]
MKALCCIPLLLFALWHTALSAQDPFVENLDKGSVEWVGQYPSNIGAKKTFLQKVDRIVFGNKPSLINTPVCALIDGNGSMWILNQGNGIITRIHDSKTSELKAKNLPHFPSLVSACLLPDQRILITDSYLNAVFLISENGDEIDRFIPLDSLQQPTGIAYSYSNEQIWILETAAHRVSVFSLSGKYIKSFGGRGIEPGKFNFPTHIWIDKKGTAYIVDAMNFRIQLFTADGEFISAFGIQGTASGSLARPKGIATDSYGNIYVADALFNSVQVFNKEGALLHYFGIQGSEQGQFWMPAGLYIDDKDYIYVSDSYNNRIQIFQYLPKESDEE